MLRGSLCLPVLADPQTGILLQARPDLFLKASSAISLLAFKGCSGDLYSLCQCSSLERGDNVSAGEEGECVLGTACLELAVCQCLGAGGYCLLTVRVRTKKECVELLFANS